MTIDIAQYFSKKDEDGAVWFEPTVNGVGIGIEFFIHGPNSNKAIIAEEYYKKMKDLADRIKDKNQKSEFLHKIEADKYFNCISDIRGKDGKDILMQGKKVALEDVKEILYKSPAILSAIDIYFRTYNKTFVIDEQQLELAVRNYFYLNQQYAVKKTETNPKTKKTETKTVYTRNIDKREDFIKKFKQSAFEDICKTDIKWAKLKTIPIPSGCEWIFSHFLEIWYLCDVDFGGNKIFRPKDIIEYCECFGITMSYYERRLLLKMKSWAMSEIFKLNTDEDF